MHESWIYRSAGRYELVMRALYGSGYLARFEAVNSKIADNASVVDLCCGPGTIYWKFLKSRGIDYYGLDLNPVFVANLRRAGCQAGVVELSEESPVPSADYIIMMGSLYHFLPEPAPMVRKMLDAARKGVLILEPVRNLATSTHPALRWLSNRGTNPGSGEAVSRFTEQSFDRFCQQFPKEWKGGELIPGGRDKLAAFEKN